MSDKELKEYVKELLVKYDYYEPLKEREEALKLAQVSGKKVLDMGTGKGWLAILAAKNYKCKVTSIDTSEENLRIAKENAKKDNVEDKIKFLQVDARKTDFKGNSFDIVIAFNLLHHMKGDYLPAIKEMFRISKHKVIITELNKAGAEVFDNYIYPEEKHSKMALDLDNMARVLSKYGTVSRHDRKIMSTFICLKNRGV
ncbi:MAG: class I SAM-dependent methyltransferase [Phycisphaerae bacterium]|jgi:ubiquinone/menaquinone biosynthesis C-methylase UbiE